MKLIEFTDFIEEIYKYYRYKNPPTSDEIAEWLLEVEFIASEALPWIFSNIKSSINTLPRNLPRTLNDQWYRYLDAHPEKFTKAEELPDYNCPECHGGGVLHFRAPDLSNKENTLIYTYVAICNSCRASWKKFGKIQHEGIPDGPYIEPMMRFTKQEILDRGYKFLEAENPYAKRPE
jgi:hypothetical protein